ncbi:MAG: nuclear transport factor 2 family protein [Pseudohongiellaceae bacterium]
MASTPELTNASRLTSAEFLAERVKHAYRTFDKGKLAELETLYTPDVYFEDPSHGLQGKQALLAYFDSMSDNLKDCRFRFHQTLTDGSDIFLSWTMFLRHPRLRRGETIRVEGASYLKTRNGRIYYHRDYFDMGAMVYEHLPLLGRIIQRIRQRLGE